MERENNDMNFDYGQIERELMKAKFKEMKAKFKEMKSMFNKKLDEDRDNRDGKVDDFAPKDNRDGKDDDFALKDNRVGKDDYFALKAKTEKYVKFGYCGTGLSFVLTYCLFTVGHHGSRPKFVDIWNSLITVFFCITFSMQFTSIGLPKVLLNTMLALLLVSMISLYIFALVNL